MEILRANMQAKKVQFAAMIYLCMCTFRKGNGFSCRTGHPPLWESPTQRCTFHINWDCFLDEGEEVLLKTWTKDDATPVAKCSHSLNFTTENGFKGRVERHKEYGFILKDLTTQDAGYYKLVVIIRDTELEVNTSSVYIPSIPSCETDLFYVGTNTKHIMEGNSTNLDSKCDGGQIPNFMIGLLVAFGIVILVLFSISIYLFRRYRMPQNNLQIIREDRGETLMPLSPINS
ncbi:hypothetical protein ACJMK2_024464 [Sinanodonta woodiana]|uniref:Uncharacterized protein n=1 Tax=Sinanodonta woodiana TaxID=1069815 RepID=A0ABD3XH21_SINWO